MTCVPGKIRVSLSDSLYYRWQTGLHSARDLAKRQVTCDQCGLTLATLSLPLHLESQDGLHPSRILEEEFLADDPLVVYRGTHLLVGKKFLCPVPWCVGEAVSEWGLQPALL